jgi:hypothetical protein
MVKYRYSRILLPITYTQKGGLKMANFTVRVVLHGTESSEYEELHEFMEATGFSRTITNSGDVEFHLPPREYTIAAASPGPRS